MHADVLLVLALEFLNIGVDRTALNGYNANGSTGFVVDDNVRIHAKTSGAVAGNRVAIDDDIEHSEITDSSGFKTYIRCITNSRNCNGSFLGNVKCSRLMNPAFVFSGKDVANKIEGLPAGLNRRKRMYLNCMIRI